MMKNVLYVTAILLCALTKMNAQDCNLNQDAQRYWVRANAAIKDAKNDADYLNAVEEFKNAAEYAPDCPDIVYNIAMCYDKSASSGLLKDIWGYGKAMEYFKKYLELKPDAQNKQTVQNKIYELEYKYDKLNKIIGHYIIKNYDTSKLNVIEAQFIRFFHQFVLFFSDKNQIIVLVDPNIKRDTIITLVAEDYKNKEGIECLKFCFPFHVTVEDCDKSEQKSMRSLPSNFWNNTNDSMESMDIICCYYLKLIDGKIILEFEPQSIWWYDKKGHATQLCVRFNLSDSSKGIYDHIYNVNVQLEKIESSSAAQSPIFGNPTDNDKNNKSTDNQQSGSGKKNTNKSVGSSIFSTILK